MFIILLIILSIIGYFSYTWYVKIIMKRNRANEALSDIDVQLKLRADLIPNILTIAKKFMEHESDLLTSITNIREQANTPYDKSNAESVKAHLDTAGVVSGMMSQLKITMENYPVLKSDQTMINAMNSYNEVESQISAARRFYNSAVTELNDSVQIFPGTVISSIISVNAMPFFIAEEADKEKVDSSKYL